MENVPDPADLADDGQAAKRAAEAEAELDETDIAADDAGATAAAQAMAKAAEPRP